MSVSLLIPGFIHQYSNYARAVWDVGGDVQFSNDCIISADISGLLLPGGGDIEPWRYGEPDTACRSMQPERDALEWALLQQAAALEIPVLGICRGMQMINVFCGGTLIQHCDGHDALHGTDRLHEVHAAPSFLSSLYGASQVVNSAHHQAVKHLGRHLHAIQWAHDGIIEAIQHENLPMFGVQWHPERLCGPMARAGAVDGSLLLRAFLQKCVQNKRRNFREKT